MTKSSEYITDLFHKIHAEISKLNHRIFVEKPKPESDEVQPHYTVDAIYKNNQTEEENEKTIRATLNLPPTIRIDAKTEERQKPWYKDRVVWLQIVTILVGAVVAIIYGFQLSAMRRAAIAAENANTIAQKTLIAANRSWIEFRMPDNWQSQTLEHDISELRTMNELTVTLKCTNIGKFPITRFFAEGRADIYDSKKTPVFDYATRHNAQRTNIIFPTRSTGIDVADLLENGSPLKITDEVRYQLLSGNKYLIFYARARFMDSFGEHWIQYCNAIGFNPYVVYQYGSCIEYNDTGDGVQNWPMR